MIGDISRTSHILENGIFKAEIDEDDLILTFIGFNRHKWVSISEFKQLPPLITKQFKNLSNLIVFLSELDSTLVRMESNNINFPSKETRQLIHSIPMTNASKPKAAQNVQEQQLQKMELQYIQIIEQGQERRAKERQRERKELAGVNKPDKQRGQLSRDKYQQEIDSLSYLLTTTMNDLESERTISAELRRQIEEGQNPFQARDSRNQLQSLLSQQLQELKQNLKKLQQKQPRKGGSKQK